MLSTPLVLIFSVALIQWSPTQAQAQAHPDLSSEVSFHNDILEFLTDDVQPLEERSFTASPRLISYTWFPPPSQNVVGFNISVDISPCPRGVKSYTNAGIYTHSNGTILDNATAKDILEDLKAMRREAPDQYAAERMIWNHTLTIARDVQDMSNRLLDGDLVCESTEETSSGEITHNELRHLLWFARPTPNEIWHFSIMLASSSIAGIVAGGATALAAWVVDYRNNHGDERHNKTLTDREVRNEYIIVGITTFIATLAADIVSELQARRRERIRIAEAWAASLFFTMSSQAIRDLRIMGVIDRDGNPVPQPDRPALPRAIPMASDDFGLQGKESAPLSSLATRDVAARTCVTPDEAAEVAMSFGTSLLPQIVHLSDKFRFESPAVVEAEIIRETVSSDGRCSLAH